MPPRRRTHRIHGRAEEAEIAAYNQQAKSADPQWSNFAQAMISNAISTFGVERKRCLSAGTFHDGSNGAFFVLAVNTIMSGIAEPHKKCAQRLMSMDPIATFFVMVDPRRDDSGFNGAVRDTLMRGITWAGRAESKSAYLGHFAAACSSIGNADEVVKCMIALKKPSAADRNSHADKFYAAIASDGKYDGCDYYGCLSAGIRSRIQTYDRFRYQMFITEKEFYPSTDAMSVIKAAPYIDEEDARLRSMRTVVESYLNGSGAKLVSVEDAGDSRQAAETMHFFCSDFFGYLPLCDEHVDRIMSGIDKFTQDKLGVSADALKGDVMVATGAVLDKRLIAPICTQRYYKQIFDAIF